MIFAAENIPTYYAGIVEEMQRNEWGYAPKTGYSATEISIDKIQTDETAYDLNKNIQLVISWQADQWVCWAKEFGADCIGYGDNCWKSKEEWEKVVHARFQMLYQKRPFEMDDKEQREWSAFCRYIDVRHYRETIPIKTREIGCIHYGKYQYPTQIEWITGRKDHIDLVKICDDTLKGCRPGQWIEAHTRRDPKTGLLLSIDHVQKISTINPTEQEMQNFEKNMPKAKLPESDWE